MPDTLPGGGAEARAARRSNVFLSAVMVTAGGSVPVRVRNISARGALLDGSNLPPSGTAVELRRGSLSARGEIAWLASGACGVRLLTDIDVESWTRRTEHSGQQGVDEMVALVRRPAAVAASAVAPPSPADSLADISAALDKLCERLAGRPDLVANHGDALLDLDSIAQRLRKAASRGPPV